jgi:hypothetical protein
MDAAKRGRLMVPLGLSVRNPALARVLRTEMGKIQAKSPVTRRLAGPAMALAALIALVAALGGSASAARTEASLLGKKGKVQASCPKTPCEAVGSVTGFQKEAGGKNGIFKMPVAGKIIGWSIDISKPSAAQISFFGSFYKHDKLGTDPYARIGVLRRKKNKGGRFKLRKQSPRIDLSNHLGSRPIIALNRPIPAARGDVVAITVPTWAPIFAVGRSERNAWVASRAKDKCSGVDNIKAGRPHQKTGSLRTYGCTYTTARLAYWAYYVPKEAPAEKS